MNMYFDLYGSLLNPNQFQPNVAPAKAPLKNDEDNPPFVHMVSYILVHDTVLQYGHLRELELFEIKPNFPPMIFYTNLAPCRPSS